MNGTNRTLYHYHEELESMKGSIVAHFFASKAKQFYNDNGIRVKTLYERLRALQEKYFQFESENKISMDEDKKPVMIEGLLLEDYTKEFNELMDKEINIKL